MLELAKVSKNYDSKLVLKDFSFKFKALHKYIITGSNGVGKSTLLQIIADVILASSGTVSFSIENPKMVLGWVPANASSFLPELSGRENLLFFFSLYSTQTDAFNSQIEYWARLEEFNFLDEKVLHYSSGMLQKLNFLRGIIHNPQILVLDEPLENLDSTSVEMIKAYLINFKGLLIISTHRCKEWDELNAEIINLEKIK